MSTRMAFPAAEAAGAGDIALGREVTSWSHAEPASSGRIADVLIARGHDVVVLDDLSGGVEAFVTDATFVRASATDAAEIDALFARRSFDYVFHLAAYAAEGFRGDTRGIRAALACFR